MDRGNNWETMREAALERDQECRKCGAIENLHVHHIIPYRKSRTNKLWNLVTLCGACHKIVENLYTRYYLTSQMIRWVDENWTKGGGTV